MYALGYRQRVRQIRCRSLTCDASTASDRKKGPVIMFAIFPPYKVERGLLALEARTNVWVHHNILVQRRGSTFRCTDDIPVRQRSQWRRNIPIRAVVQRPQVLAAPEPFAQRAARPRLARVIVMTLKNLAKNPASGRESQDVMHSPGMRSTADIQFVKRSTASSQSCCMPMDT